MGRKAAILWVGALAVGILVCGTAPATAAGPGPVLQRPSGAVTADALPTAQIDGVAWTQLIVGNTVYVGGSFAHARPAGVALGGAGTVTRTNLMAYDITTGAIVAGLAPSLNAQVRSLAASPDGTRLYVGGDFTTVNGVTHNRIAAFDTTTGALISSFAPRLDATVKTLAVSNTAVYAGGLFSSANGVGRSRLAAFAPNDGALTAWAPTADYTVNALVLTPDGSKVVVGGAFQFLNGLSVRGLAAVDPVTGAVVPWLANQAVYAYGTGAAFLSLTTDGTAVYGTAYNFHGTGNLEGAFSADPLTGKIIWIEDCHGDTYGIHAGNGVAYTVSHAHYCLNLGGTPEHTPRIEKHSMAFTAQATGVLLNDTQGYPSHTGLPCPSVIDWFPDYTTGTYTGQNQAAWSVAGNGQYLVEACEFPTVNGQAQQGLVRYAVPSIAPRKQGARVTGNQFVPTLSAQSSTSVRVSFTSNWDRDDQALTYRIVRDGNTASPIYTVTGNSQWWNLPAFTFLDTGLSVGRTYAYRLYVSDGDGNSVAGDSVSITTPGGGGGSTTAADQFSRTVSGGWGGADVGGAWTASGPAAQFAVNGSTGTITLPSPGSGYAAFLNSVSTRDVTAVVEVGSNKAVTGTGVFYSVAARHTAAGDYRAKVKLTSTGDVSLYLTRVLSGTETTLVSGPVAGLTASGTDRLRLKLSLSGTNPTTLSAKVWKSGTTEPASPQFTSTDSSAALQSAGGLGVWAYVSGSSTNTPVVLSFDQLAAG